MASSELRNNEANPTQSFKDPTSLFVPNGLVCAASDIHRKAHLRWSLIG